MMYFTGVNVKVFKMHQNATTGLKIHKCLVYFSNQAECTGDYNCSFFTCFSLVP